MDCLYAAVQHRAGDVDLCRCFPSEEVTLGSCKHGSDELGEDGHSETSGTQ